MSGEEHRRTCRWCAKAKRWNDLMLGILPIEATVVWVACWRLIQRDWTVVFAPLLATAGAVVFWLAWYKIYGPVRDAQDGTP